MDFPTFIFKMLDEHPVWSFWFSIILIVALCALSEMRLFEISSVTYTKKEKTNDPNKTG